MRRIGTGCGKISAYEIFKSFLNSSLRFLTKRNIILFAVSNACSIFSFYQTYEPGNKEIYISFLFGHLCLAQGQAS